MFTTLKNFRKLVVKGKAPKEYFLLEWLDFNLFQIFFL